MNSINYIYGQSQVLRRPPHESELDIEPSGFYLIIITAGFVAALVNMLHCQQPFNYTRVANLPLLVRPPQDVSVNLFALFFHDWS